MRIALDTNVLAYAEGVDDASRQDVARDIIKKLPGDSLYLPVQVLGELFNVLTRKTEWPAAKIRDIILGWRDSAFLIPTSSEVLLAAVDLTADHRIPIWDSIILVSAAQASCRLLLSQDFHDGFSWSGVTVTNPFSTPRHPLLNAVLSGTNEMQ